MCKLQSHMHFMFVRVRVRVRFVSVFVFVFGGRAWCDVVCCSCSCSGLMLCGVFVAVFVFSNVLFCSGKSSETNCVLGKRCSDANRGQSIYRKAASIATFG